MACLVLTVHGPFAYVEDQEGIGSITLMAPMCSQHKGGISTIDKDSEFIFAGNGCNQPAGGAGAKTYKYELKINAGNVTGQTWYGQGSVLPCPKPSGGLNPNIWRFWITVPKPDALVKVNPIDADVTGPLPAPTTPLAVGIRFIYDNWNGTDMPVFLNGQQVKDKNGNAVVFTFNNLGGHGHCDLELEYAGPVRDDPEHEDAVSCFANLMQCLGLNWSIAFPTPSLHVTHRNDCKAAVAWLT
jgi:hypothetical protein